MKILICSSIYPGLAGIPVYCEHISEELQKKGHEISIICEKQTNQKEYEEIEKRKIHRVKLTKDLKKDLKIIQNKIKKIGNFDLVIVLWYKYFRPVLKTLPESKKIYVLPSIRKIDIKMINKNHPFFKKYYYHLKNIFSVKLEKEAIKKSDLLICLGENMKKQVKKYYNIEKGEVISPGVDHKRFKLRKTKKDNSALIVANLDPRKGLDRAIRVAKLLKNTRIKIIGEGYLRKELENQIKESHTESKIELLGYKKNVENYMDKSFVYLMTSYSEGLPHVLIEAISSSLPCIGFKSDGKKVINNCEEIIKDNINGFIVENELEMAKKIKLLYSNKKLQKKMSKASLELSKKFSWENTTEKILENTTPKVSIIMASYNSERYIEETLNSILKDKFRDFELIIVDDASKDNTTNIIKRLSKKDKRIKLIELSKNKGPGHARNTGIKNSSGKYICYFDSDDIHLPGRFEKQIKTLEQNNNLGFVYSDLIIKYPDLNEKKVKAIEFKKNPYNLLKQAAKNKDFSKIKGPAQLLHKKDYITGSAVLWRKELNKKFKFDESLDNFEDYDLWLQFIGHKIKCKRVPLTALIYIKHKGQFSKHEASKQKAMKKIINKLKSRMYFK